MIPQLHLHILAIMVSCCFFLLPCHALPFIPQLLSILHCCSSTPTYSPSHHPPTCHHTAMHRPNLEMRICILKNTCFSSSLQSTCTHLHTTPTPIHTLDRYRKLVFRTHTFSTHAHTLWQHQHHTLAHTCTDECLKENDPSPVSSRTRNGFATVDMQELMRLLWYLFTHTPHTHSIHNNRLIHSMTHTMVTHCRTYIHHTTLVIKNQQAWH